MGFMKKVQEGYAKIVACEVVILFLRLTTAKVRPVAEKLEKFSNFDESLGQPVPEGRVRNCLAQELQWC